MSFLRDIKLANRGKKRTNRSWFFLPYDQLTDEMGPWSSMNPSDVGMVFVETLWKANLRPYHRQKLAWILVSMRAFALEQAKRGVYVDYLIETKSYSQVLGTFEEKLTCMWPAERELRQAIEPLVEKGRMELVPHEGWLTTAEDFKKSQGKTWKMDSFYRYVRKKTGILMDGKNYRGGKLSFDSENRKKWKGKPKPPTLPRFKNTPLKKEIQRLLNKDLKNHPGEFDLEAIPETKKEVTSYWSWAKKNCLKHFGPYQDAMSSESENLFHTQTSVLMHLHRLLPQKVVQDVERLKIPLASKEGFIRQVLGWREYMHHIHEETDGFRKLPGQSQSVSTDQKPGDGGYETWAGKKWKTTGSKNQSGVRTNFLGAKKKLPSVFWGEESGLYCLDHVIGTVWSTGQSHHITRLMILANIATLLDVNPRELTDWFWVAYTDAFDWVVEPNVLGMGTFSLGELMTTKPYVSGAAYIHRMSDYCQSCSFDPKKDCPITSLYWDFLARHEKKLRSNPRMGLVMKSLRKRSKKKKDHDHKTFLKVSKRLSEAKAILKETLPPRT